VSYSDIIVAPTANIIEPFENGILSARGNLLLTADDPKAGWYVKETVGIGICNTAAIKCFKIITKDS
jgi:hypothetical protein